MTWVIGTISQTAENGVAVREQSTRHHSEAVFCEALRRRPRPLHRSCSMTALIGWRRWESGAVGADTPESA